MGNLGDEYIELCGGGRRLWLPAVHLISSPSMIHDLDDKELTLGRARIAPDMVMVPKAYLFKGTRE